MITNILNNDKGVSPIVATLVLIVVAIIGAAAVALIMGSFSSNVANQASAGNTAGSSSTVINVAGSCVGLRIMSQLDSWYAANNTGIIVNTVSGGSCAGLITLEEGAANIARMAENPNTYYSADVTQYNLKTYQIGESGVCFVTKAGNGEVTIAKSQLINAYSTGVLSNVQFGWPLDGRPATEIVAESYDTNVMRTYLGINNISPSLNLVNSQGAVVQEILSSGSGAYPIGCLDSSFAFSIPGIQVLSIHDDSTNNDYQGTWSNIQNEIQNYNDGGNDPGLYPVGLIRPVMLVTKGVGSSDVLTFIKYVQSPDNQATFTSSFIVHVSQVGSYFRLTPPIA